MMLTYGTGESDYVYTGNGHTSVLKKETLEIISPKDGEVYIDATFGAGGHTRALLEAADCQVIAVDRDPYTRTFANHLASIYPKRFSLVHGRFSDMQHIIADFGLRHVDGIIFDLGISSMQVDTPRRGFSFSHDGPLDMRMNDEEGMSAADFVNSADVEELAGVIFKFGGERASRRIAAAIVAARSKNPIRRTSELANLIRRALGRYDDKIDPATRTFQALRIWVNDELNEVMRGLHAAETVLTPGGRLAVISFHSGEDKIVKDFLKDRSKFGAMAVSRYQPPVEKSRYEPTFELVSKKAVVPSDQEILQNPRSRSAKLRGAIRTSAQDWNGGTA